MTSRNSTEAHRKHLAVLARMMLAGHLDGIPLTSLTTQGSATVHTNTPDGGQIVAERLGVTAHAVHGNHHEWSGDWHGDYVRVTAIGELTRRPEVDTENDGALVALAAEAVAS